MESTRRDVLKGFGTLGVTSLAGCTGILDGDTENTPTDDGYETDTPTPTPEPEPNYELVAELPDQADLTDKDYLELELYIERELDGETEPLAPENLEITGETIRNHPDYDQDLLREAGLHTDINEIEYLEDRLWRIQKTDLIAGNNTLNLEIQFQDPEHGENHTYTTEEELTIRKTGEETREDTWIHEPELWQQLRDEHIQGELNGDHYLRGGWNSWGEIADDVEQTVPEEYDIEDMDREDTVQRYAWEWIKRAQDAVNGQPSGQAHWLAYTLETILDEAQAGRMNNTGHHTVLAHFHDEEKTYHVETARGGITTHPPAENGWTAGNKDKTPLWTTENNLGQAHSTLEELVKIRHRYEERADDELEFEFGHNIEYSDDFLIESMATLREGGDAGLIDFLQDLAITTELSPGIEYSVEGAVEEQVTATI